MKRMTWGLVSLLLLGSSLAWSDTVTTTDHLSVNGNLLKMTDGLLTLEARFSPETKTLQIQMTTVESIEFNGTTFNPGVPPKVLGIGPAREKAAAPVQENGSNVIVLRGGERRDCLLSSIDAQSVHCAGKNIEYGRRVVLRILVGTK